VQLFVNDLTVIDFSYLCTQRGIVGESWIVDVLLTGDLNTESMVLDFGIVKKQIKAIIDDEVDHKLVLPIQNKQLTVTSSTYHENHQWVDFVSERGSYYLQSPTCAFASIASKTIDIESITKHLQQVISKQLPSNVIDLQLTLRPEQLAGDYYHYTHGLKKHQGNCQRIAHGHRSPIHLYKNGQRDIQLEQQWCLRWQDIYLATHSDAISAQQSQVSTTGKIALTDHQCFAYEAPQGRFDIAVPEQVLEIVDCDSTVELLADYILRQLQQQYPHDELRVVAFEGVGKGAIAHA